LKIFEFFEFFPNFSRKVYSIISGFPKIFEKVVTSNDSLSGFLSHSFLGKTLPGRAGRHQPQNVEDINDGAEDDEDDIEGIPSVQSSASRSASRSGSVLATPRNPARGGKRPYPTNRRSKAIKEIQPNHGDDEGQVQCSSEAGLREVEKTVSSTERQNAQRKVALQERSVSSNLFFDLSPNIPCLKIKPRLLKRLSVIVFPFISFIFWIKINVCYQCEIRMIEY